MGQSPQSKFEQFKSVNNIGKLAESGVDPYTLAQNVCGSRNVADLTDLTTNNVSDFCNPNTPIMVRIIDGRGLPQFAPAFALPGCGSQPFDDPRALNEKHLIFACSPGPAYISDLVRRI